MSEKTKVRFPVIEGKIAAQGIVKKDIAAYLGISGRALSDKLHGTTDFWWSEVCALKELFPDVGIEELMRTE